MRFYADYIDGIMEVDGESIEDMDETSLRRAFTALYYSLEATENELAISKQELKNTMWMFNVNFFILVGILIFEIITNGN